MSWLIQCTDRNCKKQTWAGNIVDLIKKHTDKDGWLLCDCGKQGYIEKLFETQEGETWEPFLRGIISLGLDDTDTYQPFVFIVGYSPEDPPQDVWFSYYKDLRKSGGRLKLGYGPGGPPVLGINQILELIKRLLSLEIIKKEELLKITA